MTAPDRVWIQDPQNATEYGRKITSADMPPGESYLHNPLNAYIRADLPPTDAQIMAHPSVAALVKALEKIRDGDALPTSSSGGMPPSQYAFIRRAGPWAQIAIAALAAMPRVQE